MKKYIAVIVCCMLLASCAAFDPFLSVDGQMHTEFGDSAGYIGTLLNTIGDCIPGYGVILKGLGGLSLLLGGIATKVALSRKDGVIKTVVQGVDMASKRYDDLKANILNIVSFDFGLHDKVLMMLKTYEESNGRNFIKSTINSLANSLDTETKLNKEVKKYEVKKEV